MHMNSIEYNTVYLLLRQKYFSMNMMKILQETFDSYDMIASI